MNFWRASILPLVLTAAALLSLCAPNVEAQPTDCVLEHREAGCPTWFGWAATPAAEPVEEAGIQSADSEQDRFFQPKKRNRKCWRSERSVSLGLVPVKSPAEASRPDFSACDQDTPSPAVSDLLFIVGGYTRLFQKG